jgi:hypothetical protein
MAVALREEAAAAVMQQRFECTGAVDVGNRFVRRIQG